MLCFTFHPSTRGNADRLVGKIYMGISLKSPPWRDYRDKLTKMCFLPSRHLLLALSTLYSFLTISHACPGPDCAEPHDQPLNAVYLTTTKPCMGCHHASSLPLQHPIITIMSHKCASQSVVPYTSGSSTYWVSSASCPRLPAVTSWIPANEICIAPQSCGPASTIYENVTLPASSYEYVTTLPASTQVM